MVRIQFLSFFFALWCGGSLFAQQTEAAYYQIETLPIPEGMVLEVGGMAFLPGGELAVCTRRGEIWITKNPAAKTANRSDWTRYAQGLHEPLGLAYKDGSIYATQRGELTKMTDRNGDGKADRFETICSWPLSGNYHDYSYGPLFLPNGNMLVALNLSWIGYGASLVKWRGWMLEITDEGEIMPFATGFRSPAGFGLNAEGDLFYSDNQGDWVGSGRVTHIEKGDFAGNPQGLKWATDPRSPVELRLEMFEDSMGTLYEAAQKMEGIKPPTTWFPHGTMGISTSAILMDDTKGKFGPFAGQLLVGDQGQSKIMRMFTEKVEGVYQGIIFPFREGFSSGLLREAWDANGTLYVGMTNRGWASTGKEPFGIQRLKWTGKIPFEMLKVEAEADGFTIHFTQAVNPVLASKPESYSVQGFTYAYYSTYGSSPKLMEPCPIRAVQVSADGLSAKLVVDGLREGFVHEIKAAGLRSKSGQPLLHDFGFYTLNRIPGGGGAMSESGESSASTATKSTKRQTSPPASWTNGPDESLTIGTVPGMKYNKTVLQVSAGSKVKLTFTNNDDMQHNIAIVENGAADEVGDLAIQMGVAGPGKSYVPETEKVLFHTRLLDPETEEAIYFVAPSQPGTYQYVCTMPGHHISMRGVLEVK
jgi:glucose/arabinose dehydrogenase/azurin